MIKRTRSLEKYVSKHTPSVDGPMHEYLVTLPVDVAMDGAGADVRIARAATQKDAVFKRLNLTVRNPVVRDNLLKRMEVRRDFDEYVVRVPTIPRPEGVTNEHYQRLKEGCLASALYEKFDGKPFEWHLERAREYFKAGVLE
ncbi:hypothetical protein KW805_01505 [Candidatus Pacearchaeota archaeon]|nr:hypothetical protein [Candidatus Pacearchaeota archaeon]